MAIDTFVFGDQRSSSGSDSTRSTSSLRSIGTSRDGEVEADAEGEELDADTEEFSKLAASWQGGEEGRSERESEEEVLMERHLLRTKVFAMETQARERADDLYFAGLKLKEKDAQIAELKAEAAKQVEKFQQALRQIDDLQQTCQAQYSQNLELQYHLRQHSIASRRLISPPTEPGVDKFQKQKDLTLQLLRKKKKVISKNQSMQKQMAVLEEARMWQEDPLNSVVGDLMESIRQRDEIQRKEKMELRGRSQSLINSHSRDSRSEASWDLPNHKTIITTTEDSYIDCKLKRSIFGEQLQMIRQEISPVLRDFKDSSDKVVTQLWYLFTNKKASYRPKDEFFKVTTGMLTKSKVLLAEVLRRINTVIKSFLKEEKDIKEKWRQMSLPDCHVECQADIPPPPDPVIEELKGEVSMLKGRLSKLRSECAEREHTAYMAKEKAELSLKFLQRKFFDLHQELYTSLHQVYKHRYRWIARYSNPLRDMSNNGKTLQVQFNVHLGRIIDKDIEYVKKFGEYFVSDDKFGVDMSALNEERERVRQQELRERRSKSKIERRKSAPMPGQGMGARVGQGAAKLAEGGEDKKAEWDMSRMENWRMKQHQLWERKRSLYSQSQRESVSYIAAETTAPNASASTSTADEGTAPRPADFCDWKKDVVANEQNKVSQVNLPKRPSTSIDTTAPPAPLPSEPSPPNKSAIEVFNRIILRRRNLPLRPSSEPKLIEGAYGSGYLLEGSRVAKRRTVSLIS